jgi:hypothetical protein
MITKSFRFLTIIFSILFLCGASFNVPRSSSTFPITNHSNNLPLSLSGWEYVDQIGGSINQVSINGQVAYIGQGLGLSVLDITDPLQPQELSTIPLGWRVEDIEFSGQFAYAAAGDVEIFDIQEPRQPVFKGHFETDQIATGIHVAGNKAYIADLKIEILDLTDPIAPVRIATYSPTTAAYDVFVVNEFAYVLHDNLDIVDISNPIEPTKVGSAGNFYNPKTVWVEGSYAYVTATSGLFVFDVSLPTDPELVWHLSEISNPPESLFFYDFKAIGNLGYGIAGGSLAFAGLYIFDLSNPNSPSLLGHSEPTFISASNFDISGNFAYVAGEKDGLQVFDLNNSSTPNLLVKYETPFGSAYAETIYKGNLYLIDHDHLSIFDLSDPEKLVLRKHYAIANDSYWIQVVDDRAYFSDHGMLIIIDVSDPNNPVVMGNPLIFTDGWGGDFIYNNRAYVLSCDLPYNPPSGKMRIFDLTDPQNVTILSIFETLGCASVVRVVDNFAYITSWDLYYHYLQILDVSDPKQIQPEGVYVDPELGLMTTVVDKIAYVMDDFGGLTILDVQQPEKPTLISQIDGLPGNFSWYHDPPLVKDSLVYLISGLSGSSLVRVFNVSSPTQPLLRGYIELPYLLSGIEHQVRYLYLTREGGAGDMVIFREAPFLYLPLVFQ